MSDEYKTPVRMHHGVLLPRSQRRVQADIDKAMSLPEFGMVVGRDSHSGGSTLWATLPNGGLHQSWRVLEAHRWQSPPQSLEECVQIAYRAIASYAAAAGIDLS